MRSSNTSFTCQSLFALVSYMGDSVEDLGRDQSRVLGASGEATDGRAADGR
jgi:hypothetical protein